MKAFRGRLLSIIILLSGYICVSAQDTATHPVMPVDEDSKLITYKEVIQEKGTRNDLYIRGIAWINSFYKNPQEVTRVRDADNGIIKGIARFKTYYTDKDGFKREGPIIEYAFTLEFKDGRYRYIMTDFIQKLASRTSIERWMNTKDNAYNPQWDDYLRQVDTYVKDAVKGMKKAMEPKVIKPDNW
jgi:hypothetical protein